MLAVHELAANAVEHGGGTGRLRMSVTNRELICQVSDPGPASFGLPRSSTLGSQRPGAAARTSPWPYEPGHGLWLVRRVADHISVNCSPAGSQVTVAFTMLRSAMP
jgi:anti-sigma regulatory factor (Ser/Thr protein kinase)